MPDPQNSVDSVKSGVKVVGIQVNRSCCSIIDIQKHC